MSLKEEISQGSKRIKQLKEQLNQATQDLDKLKKKTEVEGVEFLSHLDDFVRIRHEEKEYNYILGGDGRSLPWDEKRLGIVATVHVNEDVYLNDRQLNIIKEWLKEDFDHVEIKK